jgi:hypothetical protein
LKQGLVRVVQKIFFQGTAENSGMLENSRQQWYSNDAYGVYVQMGSDTLQCGGEMAFGRAFGDGKLLGDFVHGQSLDAHHFINLPLP